MRTVVGGKTCAGAPEAIAGRDAGGDFNLRPARGSTRPAQDEQGSAQSAAGLESRMCWQQWPALLAHGPGVAGLLASLAFASLTMRRTSASSALAS